MDASLQRRDGLDRERFQMLAAVLIGGLNDFEQCDDSMRTDVPDRERSLQFH